MQIFVKTLTFGTVAIDVEAADTIEELQKKVRLHLDRMCDGFDVELVVDREGAHGYEYKGKQLEAGKTLSDYNILKESTINMVSGLGGQAKRGRGSTDPDDSGEGKADQTSQRGAIPDLALFSMISAPKDPACIQSAIDNAVNIDELLGGLGVNELENLKQQYAKYKDNKFKDTPIRSYAAALPIMIDLKETQDKSQSLFLVKSLSQKARFPDSESTLSSQNCPSQKARFPNPCAGA